MRVSGQSAAANATRSGFDTRDWLHMRGISIRLTRAPTPRNRPANCPDRPWCRRRLVPTLASARSSSGELRDAGHPELHRTREEESS